ncbi:MAG: DUF4928 family protein [Chloroflexi bacterium]|nr:DUF4928 family protein [Chloroflexota bacterium]
MTNRTPCESIIERWWRALGTQTRGHIAGGLVLVENLRDMGDELDFDLDAHKAGRSDQLRNATRAKVQSILARFGEERVLLKEGGRTSRGLVRSLTPFLRDLSGAGLELLTADEREAEFDRMQTILVGKARKVFDGERLSFEFRHRTASREVIRVILDAAHERGKAGDVAEYLVGAKLALRFPEYDIRNSAVSAADDQGANQGDFQVNDCVIHVTVSPNNGHYDKCLRNISDGFRVFLLVRDDMLESTRRIIRQLTDAQASVESIESFVSQNIEELAHFAGMRIPQNLKALIEKYNERVAAVDTDLSLQINIPAGLES